MTKKELQKISNKLTELTNKLKLVGKESKKQSTLIQKCQKSLEDWNRLTRPGFLRLLFHAYIGAILKGCKK